MEPAAKRPRAQQQDPHSAQDDAIDLPEPNETESSNGDETGDEGLAGIAASVARGQISEGAMESLTNLRSSTSRYGMKIHEYPVRLVDEWFCTDLTAMGTRLVVAKEYYQREDGSGWTYDQKAGYLATVYGGQATTPIVVNIVRKHARVMDGAHRLHTLGQFKRNEVPMKVGAEYVLWCNLPPSDQEHFNKQLLVIQQYDSLPIRDEVDMYMKFNSGVSLSHGERLKAMLYVHDLVKVSYEFVKRFPDSINEVCAALNLPTTGKEKGRNNELVGGCFCAFNLNMLDCRTLAAPIGGLYSRAAMAVSAKEQFVQLVYELKDHHRLQNTTAAIKAAATQLEARVKKALEIYNALTNHEAPRHRINGQTSFRRMVVCLLAVSEIPNLDHECFRAFMEAMAKSNSRCHAKVRRMLTSSEHLDAAAIKRIVEGYDGFSTSRAALPGPVAEAPLISSGAVPFLDTHLSSESKSTPTVDLATELFRSTGGIGEKMVRTEEDVEAVRDYVCGSC
jgi:hypothetical protein